jgi:hypothetical protein
MSLLITAAVLGPLSWIAFDRTQPVTRYIGTVVPTESGVIHPGDTVTIDWTIFAVKTCEGTVRRQIIDGQGVLWDFNVVPAVAEASGQQPYHLIRPIVIPRAFGFPPGADQATGHYHSFLTWHCNFIQRLWPLHAETADVAFTVVRPAQ